MSVAGGFPTPENPFWRDWDLSYGGDAYGPIYGGHSVQIAMVNTLRTWYPAYIKQVNRILGGDILPIVKEFQQTYNNRPWSPGLDVETNVVVTGTARKPGRTNSGYRSTWDATLEIFVYGGEDWQEVYAYIFAYCATARAAIVQHGNLGGLAEVTNWTGERYLKGEMNGRRWSGIGQVDFEVNINTTVEEFAGPPSPEYAATGTPTYPSLLPLPQYPTVIEWETEVENQSELNENGAPSAI